MPVVVVGSGQLAVRGQATAGAAGDVASGTNANVVISYSAAGAGISHVVPQIVASYSADPTGGRLTIQDGATTIFDTDITRSGPAPIAFARPRKGTANTAMTITLYAGGASIVGKLNVLGKTTE